VGGKGPLADLDAGGLLDAKEILKSEGYPARPSRPPALAHARHDSNNGQPRDESDHIWPHRRAPSKEESPRSTATADLLILPGSVGNLKRAAKLA
jgi:hypothetical protein